MPQEDPWDAPGRIRVVLDLAIRLAEVLFSSGAGAADATTAMTAIARTYGVRNVDSDVTHTMLSLTWTNPSTYESVARHRTIAGRNMDFSKLTAASALFAQITEERVDLATARRRLARIISRKQTPRTVRRIGWSLIGAGAALLLGGDLVIAAVAFIASFALEAITTAMAARRAPVFFTSIVGGLIGPVAAVLVHLVDPEESARLVVIATIIVLLAGSLIFGGVQDILSGFYLTGLARLTEAVVVTIGIAASVLGASVMFTWFGLSIDVISGGVPAGGPIFITVVGAIVIVLGFALACQLPSRALWAVALLGAIGEAIYLTCFTFSLGPVWSSAAAAVVIGMFASLLARWSRTPILALVVTDLVPLLPGLVMFNALMQLASGAVAGLLDALVAAAVAAALAAGAIAGQYIMQASWRSTSRVVRRGRGPILSIAAHRRRV
ncbi:threonine/serine ThrE exporter family protein [Humibacter albus]|uniref:threonine/serine ThrE exporter family protein n=1 Tax=Humibacter albus TaxID=427754 RepID=UPI0003B41E2F|nr:threonine/serine exporter family protein [Humibacter albus]